MKNPLLKNLGLTSLIYLSLLLFSSLSPLSTEEINMHAAIASKKIQVHVLSNGKYSGNSLNAEFKNTTNKTLKVIIPAGTIFNPEDNGEQTLIQLEDVYLTLNPGATGRTEIPAFCSESNDRCPTDNTQMHITKNTNPTFEKMIKYINGKNIDKSAYQDAVWAISDKKPISNIVADNPETEAFRKHIASITGQKDSWFTSPQNVALDEAGNFSYETVNISGRLSFDCAKGDKVRQDIYLENGEPVFVSEKYMTASSNHVNYSFRLKVKGWEKGGYYIKIHNGTKELAKYEFSI